MVLGPTATGKTTLAVQLAQALGGEIISADSRQIYRGLDIGTGKDLNEYKTDRCTISAHLIDIMDATQDYSVFQFQQDFYTTYQDIVNRNHRPILCGGTGLYIESVLLEFAMAEVPPNRELREQFKNLPLDQLQAILLKMNPGLHNTTDLEHRNRLIRAIEIAQANSPELKPPCSVHPWLVIGVEYPREIVRRRITNRLHQRLKEGMIAEVEGLLEKGLSFERLHYLGLEYRFIGQHLQGELSWNDMVQKLNIAIHQFSKRQMTFFRHMEKQGVPINWIPKGDYKQTLDLVKRTLGWQLVG